MTVRTNVEGSGVGLAVVEMSLNENAVELNNPLMVLLTLNSISEILVKSTPEKLDKGMEIVAPDVEPGIETFVEGSFEPSYM
jgi:hypothetical protein